MSEQSKLQRVLRTACLPALLAISACGGATTSGVAVGKVGQGLSGHAQAAPQGAEVCVLQEALAATPGAPEKPTSETCTKAAKSDQLWRRAMVVLGAYSDDLETIAAGNANDDTGKLEAAMTGVSGDHWIEVEGKDVAARDAVAQLVNQMSTNSAKGDLGKAVKDAAPHVKTICDGLSAYLDDVGKGIADVQSGVEKRRVAHTDRRCGTVDNRPICVSDALVDRLGFANVYGELAALANSHEDAKEAVAGFCAAHQKLEEAAQKGNLSSDETYRAVVDAVKSVPRSQPQVVGAAPAPEAATKK